MQTLDNYRSTHSELRRMIDNLRSLLTPEQTPAKPDARTACELLCDLDEKVRHHLGNEDRSLYPRLLIHDDPKVKSIAWGFISGEKPLRATFDSYHTRWLRNWDVDFSDEFLAETRKVVDLVSQRIEREEQVLLPKLVEIGILREVRI
jgi:hemerythrin-like domain-containing protein